MSSCAADGENAGVDQAVQHHGGDVDRLLIGHAAAIHHLGLDAERRLQLIELRPAAMHQHGLDADLMQDGDLFDEAARGGFVGEHRAARLDDEHLVLVHADVRRRALERAHGDGRIGSAHDHRGAPENLEASLGEHAVQDGHLHRQAIVRLALDHGARAVEDFVGDRDIAAHGQAVHELGIGLRAPRTSARARTNP